MFWGGGGDVGTLGDRDIGTGSWNIAFRDVFVGLFLSDKNNLMTTCLPSKHHALTWLSALEYENKNLAEQNDHVVTTTTSTQPPVLVIGAAVILHMLRSIISTESDSM